MPFSRTDSGLIAKYKFYEEPLVWVEGVKDVAFYRCLLKGLKFRIEVSGGVNENLKLADELVV